MRVSQRHLQIITGKASPPPPNPVLERFARIEEKLGNLPPAKISRVETVQYDDSAVIARLERLEKLIETLKPKDVSATYKFEVNRDTSGKITSVTADKVPASSRTIYNKAIK